MNPTLDPTKRTLLRHLTILFPALDWLWHGETLRSEFIAAGYKVEIHQRQGSAGPYEVVIDGKPLTWEEAVGPYHLEIEGVSFSRNWTLLGTPCVSVPGLRGERGGPIGVQVIGRRGEDAATLALAAFVEAMLEKA